MEQTLTNKEMLDIGQILDLAETCGFEYNDFGRWNCAEGCILALVEEIEKFYKIGIYKMQNKTEGWLLTQPQRCYTPAAKTDIRDTFKAMGWIAPSESKKPIIGIKIGDNK